MERTIEDIIRDAEVAYKAWCERLEILDDDNIWNEDEINIIQEAFKAEYEKRRAAAINELKQKFAKMSIVESDSKEESKLTIEEMRDALYNYCDKTYCDDCVMNNLNCNIEEMDDTLVIECYNMIQKGLVK